MGAFYNSFHVRNKTQQEVHDQIVALREEDRSDCIIGPQNGTWVPVYAETGCGYPLAVTISELMKTTVLAIDIHDDDIFFYWLFQNGEEIDSFDSWPDYFGEESGTDVNIDWNAIDNSSPELLAQYAEKLRSDFDFSKCTSQEDFLKMAENLENAFQEAGFISKPNDEFKDASPPHESEKVEIQTCHPECFADLLDRPEDVQKLAAILKNMQDHESVFVSHDAQIFCDILHLPEALNSYDYLLEEDLPQGYFHITK